jgi:hypothetical protein
MQLLQNVFIFLTFLFITLKLLDIILWSWLIVLMPLYLPIITIILTTFIITRFFDK